MRTDGKNSGEGLPFCIDLCYLEECAIFGAITDFLNSCSAQVMTLIAFLVDSPVHVTPTPYQSGTLANLRKRVQP